MQVLIIQPHYLPGYKAGGPIRSLANMVDQLGDEFRFRIITSDRDLLDSSPYPGIRPDSWSAVGKAEVLYLSQKQTSPGGIRRALRATEFDALYLNSVFSPVFTIPLMLLRRTGRLGTVPLILQPRGELCPGALELKARKKQAYLSVARSSGLYAGVLWHASTEMEAADIRREFGRGARVMIAPNLPGKTEPLHPNSPGREKVPGSLRISFLSRISRKKNLHTALKLLSGLRGSVEFNIYGPIEDDDYWAECRRLMEQLPSNVSVYYRGPVTPDQVGHVLSHNHLFFLPTLGENYGHVIREALATGSPVLLSDQTPWRGLEASGVGWDLPLSDPERYRAVLQQCIDMAAEAYAARERHVLKYVQERGDSGPVLNQYRTLFRAAVYGRDSVVDRPDVWSDRRAA